MRYLDIYQGVRLILTINVTDISLDKVDDITIDSDGDIVDYTPRLLSSSYDDDTTLDEIDEGPDPRKVDTSGVNYATLASVAEVAASKTSGATRLHQEWRLRVL